MRKYDESKLYHVKKTPKTRVAHNTRAWGKVVEAIGTKGATIHDMTRVISDHPMPGGPRGYVLWSIRMGWIE